MPRLYRVVYEPIGELSDEQLQGLLDALEGQDDDEDDLFIDLETLDLLAREGVDPAVVALLRDAVGEEGAEIAWEADEEDGDGDGDKGAP